MQINWTSSFPTGNAPEVVYESTHKNDPVKQNFANHDQADAGYDSLLSSVDHPYANGMNPGKNETNRRIAIEKNLVSKFNTNFPTFY